MVVLKILALMIPVIGVVIFFFEDIADWWRDVRPRKASKDSWTTAIIEHQTMRLAEQYDLPWYEEDEEEAKRWKSFFTSPKSN